MENQCIINRCFRYIFLALESAVDAAENATWNERDFVTAGAPTIEEAL
jgi:hypothetical protein